MRHFFTTIKANSFIGILFLLLSLLKTNIAFGAEEPYVNSLRGTGVVQGAKFDVTDEKFLSSSIFYGSVRPAPYSLLPENIVELKFNYDTSTYFYNKIFTANVNITVLCYNNPDDTSQVFTQYNNINLSIKHDTASGSPYKGVYFMKFSGAYKFRVIINSVSSPELGTNMPKVLIVEGKTIIKRKYVFSLTTSDITKIDELPNQVKLSWIPANYPGAENFDLEYTIIDDSSTSAATLRTYIGAGTAIPQAIMEDFFRNNASRITTSASTYTLNPLYQAGFLLFRIRGVQFANEYQPNLSPAEQNLRSEGNWNYRASKISQPGYQYNVVKLQWHEPDLNWQYAVSFAEEGKRKEVISYYDGIFKNHQNVTINNSDNKTVVQETVYDALGRAAISVLPVPGNDSVIRYFPNFNKNAAGKGYSYKDFLLGAICRTVPQLMSSSSGANKYYSSSNDVTDKFFKKYIPQAEGYPFSVTEFTPDNTGRIFAQSGVGKDFQPGSGHETTYYYSKPTQEELDRLFGSEAGNASHYLKNMVVDPNGQISVSYVNAGGKTIATALAGKTPMNVQALSSNNGVGTDVIKNLLMPQDFEKDYSAGTLLGNTSFLAAVSGDYKFNYSLTPLRLDLLHGISNQLKICNTCYYDLIITVKNNCSEVLKTVSRPVDPGTIFQADCNITPALIADNFTLTIDTIGEYSVSYFLKISEKALGYYDSLHLAQNTNLRSFNSFVLEKLNNADFKDCFSDCATCFKDLGTKTDFINNKVKPLFLQADSIVFAAEFNTWAGLLYDSLLANCSSIQSECIVIAAPCDEEKQLLLSDVKPGGQYAPYDSITYKPTETYINVMRNYRWSVTFRNEDGTVGMIEVNGVPRNANDTVNVSWKLFIENFRDSWAEALLPFHPEYCFYQWCLSGTNPASKSFDLEITDIADDSTATAKGYFGTVSSLLIKDPFFKSTGSGFSLYNRMLDSLNLFSRTIHGYTGPDFNIKQYIDYELYCEESNIAPGNCVFPPANSPCRSSYSEWQLYRDYYLNLKAYFNEKARLMNPAFANCKNCYIGTDHTEILKCTPPAPADFSVIYDTTYKIGNRIIVKYKNGEEAVSKKLKLTFSYSSGTFTQIFKVGKSTESFNVIASTNNAYSLIQVVCDTTTAPASRPAQTEPGKSISALGSQVINAVPGECPCPPMYLFDVFGGIEQCPDGEVFYVNYSGPAIPPNRTVYVDVVWHDLSSNTSGISTVSFTTTYTQASGCTGFGMMAAKTPGIIQSGNQKILSPAALAFIEPLRDSMARLKQSTDTSLLVNGNRAFMYDISYMILDVYCYDNPQFVCPGSNVEPKSLCKDDPLYVYYKDKIRRYDGYQNTNNVLQDMTANYSNYQSQAQINLDEIYQSNCEAMADAWINALRKCTTDSATLANIKAGLIQVCKSGSDIDHPYGASTYPNLSWSFEDVIRLHIPNASDSCTAELISDPYPYNTQPSFDNRTLIKIDNCLSTRFAALKTQFLGSGFAGTFHQWLQKQLKNDYQLTQQQLTDLEASINGGCKYLKRPLMLPVAFNCSNTPACVDSAKTMQTYNAFMVKFPEITAANENYELLLTNYFNHTLGFNLNFDEYQAFISKCQTGTTNKDLLCNKALSNAVEVKEKDVACMEETFNLAIAQATNEYTVYIDSVRAAFRAAYTVKCLNAAPKLTMKAKLYEYHYTLYYYDQSGNLIKTIPPEGVKLLTDPEVVQVSNNRNNRNGYCFSDAPEINLAGNIFTMNRDVSYDPVIDGKYSLESWVKLSSFSSGGGLFSYNDIVGGNEIGYSLVVKNSKLVFTVGTGSKLQVETPVLSTFLTTGSWFHLAVTVNNGSNKPVNIYINGSAVPLTYLNNNSAVFVINSSYTHKLKVGSAFESGATTINLNSGFKQFRWYQRLLPASEIQLNAFNTCLTTSSVTGLISHIPLNEGTGNVLKDEITGNSSTITGNTTVQWINNVSGIYPKHQFATSYFYNSYNQVLTQNTPDGGTSFFWYDILGRLVASQNSEQLAPKNPLNNSANRYSYTKYDSIGRITEVGEKYSGTVLLPVDDDVIPPGALNTKINAQLNTWYASGTDKQVTATIYDQPNTSIVTNSTITSLQTTNSRKRVVASYLKEFKTNLYYDAATHYVYDINGNVKTLFQELTPLKTIEGSGAAGLRQINYDYDLISGKVNKVIYQPGKGDQFLYRYEYDADNRITYAYSSRDGLQWQNDAHYYYYLHGPLARVELGKYKVQGVDYAYTLQGWLKGINSQSLDVAKDMAGDGNPASPAYAKFGRDVYGFSLGYHNNDYKPIGGSAANAFDKVFTAPSTPVGVTGNTGSQLFNGNISHSTIALNKINTGQTTGYSYLYDQLNRIINTLQHKANGTSWSFNNADSAYKEKFRYDANGNILSLLRRGANVTGMLLPMDSLKYFYYYTNTSNARATYDPTIALPGNVKSLSNQLAHVTDTDPAGNYPDDIDNQTAGNYDYDNIGNLMKDNAEGITGIEWTVYGKIKQIKKGAVTINYAYDVSGNRISKEVVGAPGGTTKQFYIRDATGNTLAIYNGKTSYVEWAEQHLYGSSRLGIWNYGKANPAVPGAVAYDSMMVGSFNYELTNHLGNVLSTISDKKVGVSAGKVTVDYYNAEVLGQNDYYAFGSLMPGRKYSVANTNYRYGFNGKERDNEVSGEGNQYDYGFRIYNPRLGRFLSVDPLTKEYPMLSPYPFAENQPIWAIDLDGLEKYIVINYLNKGGQIYKTEIRGIRSIDSKSAVNMQMKNSHGKSLTTKDVYVINQLANGKIREVGGKNNLNSEEQKLYNIAKNVSPENNSEGDENLPFENNISDALDTQNGTFSSKTFNQDKYEFFGITQKVTPLKIVSNPESNQPRQLFDNGHNDHLVAGNIIIRDVEKIVNDFKKANPKATDIKINVLFTTLNTNANFVSQIANRLEAIGIKTKIVTENNYRSAPVPGNTSSKHDFRFETKVTGIIKQ